MFGPSGLSIGQRRDKYRTKSLPYHAVIRDGHSNGGGLKYDG